MEFYKIKKVDDKNYYYNGKLLSSAIKLADPSFDLTFKSLFSQSESAESKWKNRAISLLQSLIIEGNIKTITTLSTECILPDIKKNKNGEHLLLLRSDLAFQLEMETKDKEYKLVELVNIEMQLGYLSDFLERLLNYGLSLRKKNKEFAKDITVKTIVLGFINYKGSLNFKSNSYYLSEFNSENNCFIRKIDDLVDIVIINLNEISNKLENDEKIYILGKEVNKTGKNWLKLLSLRNWAINDGDNYYKIPKININTEINSAINYLQEVTSQSLVKYSEAEKQYYDSINEAVNEKVKEKMEKMAKQFDEFKKETQAKAEDGKIKFFISIFKNAPNLDLEELEKNQVINFSEIKEDKVMSFWGDDKDKDKLESLKKFLSKKKGKKDKIQKKNNN